MKPTAIPSVYGCNGCMYRYNTEVYANNCKYATKCMAHLRKDKQSVIFKWSE